MNFRDLFTRRALGLSALVLTATITACRDATGPDQRDAASPMMSGYLTTSAAVMKLTDINFKALYPTLGVDTANGTMKTDTLVETFKIDPKRGGVVVFGTNGRQVIAIPANSLCDPLQNTYGPTEWNKPCLAANVRIQFSVRTWRDRTGRPHADFRPAMRFSPDDSKQVKLYFRDPLLTNYSTVFIPYCNSSNVCVKEETTDPEMTTYASPAPGGGYWVYRRLKHFSGYNVTAF